MLIINRGNLFPSKTKTQLTSEAILHPQGPSRFTRWALANKILDFKNANLKFPAAPQHGLILLNLNNCNSECSVNNFVYVCSVHIGLVSIFFKLSVKMKSFAPHLLRLYVDTICLPPSLNSPIACFSCMCWNNGFWSPHSFSLDSCGRKGWWPWLPPIMVFSSDTFPG